MSQSLQIAATALAAVLIMSMLPIPMTSIAERARTFLNWVRITVLRVAGCECFMASTVVWTAQGAVPISEIQVGQPVYSAAEAGQASEYAEAEVGTTIFVGEASLVKLTVRHEDGSAEVISTTDEHPFHPVHTGEWTRADALVIGDLLSTMHGVAELLAVEYGAERVPVYNLSIPGSPTYYVGTHGVWAHNIECLDFPSWVTDRFTNPKKVGYHWEKHAEPFNKSIETYINDAATFFAENKARVFLGKRKLVR